ncbi:MAG TPA: hypothetical protein VK709_05395 [Candidatus Saccharimonadales bacterium]|jgi:hypothetical protein|nr:hypothetical protein [Candidatus Saccharimonadales bacterium]
MHEMKHAILIEAEPSKVYTLVSSAEGFRKWWAADVTEDAATNKVELGFFNGATSYRLHPISLVSPLQAQWLCETGKEWSGTKLLFDLKADAGRTLLHFTHADWQAETEYFVSCTTVWGELMFRIKGTAEGKNPGPLFSGAGMAY